MPSTGTFSIGTNARDYSTISGWEADTDVSLTGQVTGECFNDSEFDEDVSIAGASNLSSTNFRRLTVASGERHDGTPLSGARINRSSTSAFNLINVDEDRVEIRWIEITGAAPSFSIVRINGVNDCQVSHTMLHDVGSDSYHGIRLNTSAQRTVVACNLIYDCASSSTSRHGISTSGTAVDSKIWNNVIDRWAGGSGIQFDDNGGTASEVRNNAVFGSNGADYTYTATPDTVSNNASSDATADDAGGTGHLINQVVGDQFVSVTDGSEDYHLKSTADLVDAAADLGDVRAAIDLDGQDRHAEAVTWDIGVDELELTDSQTFDTSIAESFSLDDTVATVITFAGNMAEALGLSDTIAGDMTFAGAVAEALALSDQVTNDMTFVAALAEVLNFDDTVEMSFVLPGALDETIQFDDTIDALVTVVAQYVEGLGIGDSVTAQLTARVAIAEAFDLNDTVDFARLYDTEVAEGITFGDLVTLVYTVSGGPTEGLGFSVTVDATIAALGALRVMKIDAPLFDERLLASSVRENVELDTALREDIRLPANLIGE